MELLLLCLFKLGVSEAGRGPEPVNAYQHIHLSRAHLLLFLVLPLLLFLVLLLSSSAAQSWCVCSWQRPGARERIPA
jgi:hypothetical protein